MPLLQRPRHSIAYETLGDPAKPPVLLIMGLALSSRAWVTLPALLSSDHYVITLDNRGTGRSARHGVAYKMRDLAADALAVLDVLGVRAAHVFGISMGGMIAQELALRAPERVRSLVLGCTFASWRRARGPGFRTALDLLLLNLGLAKPERLARLLLSAEWDEANPGKALEWMRASERTKLRFATAQLLAIVRHHTVPRLAGLKAPTLILTGDRDRLVPPVNSQVLHAAIPGSRLHVLKGAGHAFPLEREEETLRVLREHFSAAEGRARASA